MKDGVRIAAITSGPIDRSKREGRAILVCVVARERHVEGILSSSVSVDGTDSTSRIVSMLGKSRFRSQARLLALDGIALAGLNIVDVQRASRGIGTRFAVMTRSRPRKSLLISALRRFSEQAGKDVAARIGLVERMSSARRVQANGMFIQTDTEIGPALAGHVFEALRVSHLVSRGVSTGESKGRI